jgi:uncharacterized lipoprotein YddW (UPF0748 family)
MPVQIKNLLIFFLLIFLISGCAKKEDQKEFKVWVWMHPDSNKSEIDWEKDFEILESHGVYGVLIGADTAVLRKAIPPATKHNILVHAWFWAMNRGDADTSWLSVNQLGNSLATEKAYVNYYKFMCPALPEVKIFLKRKIDELLCIDGLAGIHLDYIRYVDAILPVGLQPKYGLNQDKVYPGFDYGYHPYMVEFYQEKTGINPFELAYPATDSSWLQFRMDKLNETVTELRDYINDNGKVATAAVFPTPAMSRDMVRQEWDRWNLDCYFPMVYHNFYNEDFTWIENVMKENKSVIPESSEVFCGLYVPALKNENDLSKAIDAALAGGADGVALFEYGAMDEELWEQVEIR